LRLPLLVLDEPINGLDFEATEFPYKAIIEYKEYGSVFMSSHVAESFQRCCDIVYVLKAGGLAGPFSMSLDVDLRSTASLPGGGRLDCGVGRGLVLHDGRLSTWPPI
jgi:ABC-2 type transport system ATP-binding protein